VISGPLTSWGRLTHGSHEIVRLCDRHALPRVLRDPAPPGIAHGSGRSYGDQCLNAAGPAWTTRGLDKFIALDRGSGLLQCEAGVTLSEINALTLPLGWFLPVTPGTQFVTLGGAVANDVHGKNHHDRGTFGEHVESLTLNRTDGRVIRCGPHEATEWFHATIAGMGLTGVISEVSLRLRPVLGPWIETHADTFDTLDEFFELAARHRTGPEYTVAWIDCTPTASGNTRGVFFRGDHADSNQPMRSRPPTSAGRLPLLRWVNPVTSAAFNRLYFQRQRARSNPGLQTFTSFFYPLDSVLEWNRIYGPRGFYQYQCVVPVASQVDATRELLRLIRESNTGSFLSVLKTFADRPPVGLLSFPMAGTTLALDFPNLGASTLALFDRLNAVVSAAGGRLYAAKDASMPASMFHVGYPRLEEFLKFRDPGISSEMSRRLMGN